MENKYKHMDYIQSAISRMASNSFYLKGWNVTIIAAIVALSFKESDWRIYACALALNIVFWVLDAYYLKQEKLFRELYNKVSKISDDNLVDFSMNTSEFKEKVSRQNKKDYGEIYDRLYQARYNLLRLYRTDKFEPDYTRMPQAVKDKIKELDIAMYNVRKRTKKTASGVRLFKSELSDIAKENGGKSAVSSEDIWVDDKGVKHYASYMTKVIPVRQQYMHRVPNSNWAETSEESKFYNKNYDNSIPEAEQPKLSIKEYDNRKDYNAVMRDPALVNLRNVILDIMNEANDKITHSNYKNNYKLPQINGNIFNYWGNRGLITGTRNYMIDAFGIQPDDEIHGVKVETRPNGTEINIMPTMYTTMLNDPASGTNDLIGAITKYYRIKRKWPLN